MMKYPIMNKNERYNIVITVLISLGLSMLINLLCSLLTAYLLDKEILNLSSIPVASNINHIVSMGAGTIFVLKRRKEKILMNSCVLTIGYVLLWSIVSMVGFQGKMPNLVSILCSLLGSGLIVGMHLVKPEKRKFKYVSR